MASPATGLAPSSEKAQPGTLSNGGGIAAIRTLALVGPSAAGKTLLAEALLHKAGAINTPGSIERGSTSRSCP